jgi:hypothetical protein
VRDFSEEDSFDCFLEGSLDFSDDESPDFSEDEPLDCFLEELPDFSEEEPLDCSFSIEFALFVILFLFNCLINNYNAKITAFNR